MCELRPICVQSPCDRSRKPAPILGGSISGNTPPGGLPAMRRISSRYSTTPGPRPGRRRVSRQTRSCRPAATDRVSIRWMRGETYDSRRGNEFAHQTSRRHRARADRVRHREVTLGYRYGVRAARRDRSSDGATSLTLQPCRRSPMISTRSRARSRARASRFLYISMIFALFRVVPPASCCRR